MQQSWVVLKMDFLGTILDALVGFFRVFSSLIDSGIYWIVTQIYAVFTQIAEVDILKGIVSDFTTRIYVLLGVFMLIKISITLIKYITNPNDLTDSSKGAGKLLKNVIVSLLLLIMVPYIYKFAMDLQGEIIESKVIPNFILGTAASGSDEKAGGDVSYSVFSSFLTPKTDLGVEPQSGKTVQTMCNPMYVEYNEITDNTYKNNLKRNAQSKNVKANDDGEYNGYVLTKDCYDALQSKLEDNNPSSLDAYNVAQLASGSAGIGYLIGGINDGVSPLSAKVNSDVENYTYLFTYSWGVSWFAGIFLAYIFLTFCVDVGIRVVKLAFLVLIAPIPILSLLDPYKKGEMFNNWTKMCSYTYLDIFIRYASIFFIVFVIQRIPTILVDLFTTGAGMFATVFIIFGALLFAKQLPNLIGQLIPGMKEFGGGLDMRNPLKKMADAPILGRGVAAGLGAATGLAANYRRNRWDRQNENKMIRENARMDALNRGLNKKQANQEAKKALKEHGIKGGLLKDLDWKDTGKAAATGAASDAWYSKGWLGGENKNAIAKEKAEKRKATREQLKKMQAGYTETGKSKKIYGDIEDKARKAYNENPDNVKAGKTFDSLSKKDKHSEMEKIEESTYSEGFRTLVKATRDSKSTMQKVQAKYEAARSSYEATGTVSKEVKISGNDALLENNKQIQIMNDKNSSSSERQAAAKKVKEFAETKEITVTTQLSGKDAADYVNGSSFDGEDSLRVQVAKTTAAHEACKKSLSSANEKYPDDAKRYGRYESEKDYQEKVVGSIKKEEKCAVDSGTAKTVDDQKKEETRTSEILGKVTSDGPKKTPTIDFDKNIKTVMDTESSKVEDKKE